ncbi:hypothetical protein [Leptothoe spongobia]|uniref:Uncharacterized protein n=1 Tax=Leptothoe spongobia TAU-MAC 1115 TaxID=1967444 RepID=A0A947GH97_9CYAN|nr:hypothetical protein [Leptothoe spongobia]MBT9315400.1 hypothetical protein [Leptothoe spongobia TAU-MAC 1115]
MPQFATAQDQRYAQALMQPALIRIIDNIRKQLEASDWKGSYRDDMRWPAEATAEQKQQYLALQDMLETATPEEYDQIQAALSQLPSPEHLYTLCLTKEEQQQEIDVWQLCYRLCNATDTIDEPITIDTQLLDLEIGEVNWITLDQKAKRLVEKAFQSLV